jgi:hypothetical protein
MTPRSDAASSAAEPARPEPGKQLVGEWAVCGIAAAAARFIPVPLLDDAVRLRATQIAVVRTLRAADRDYPSDHVEALYAGADAGSAGKLHEALRYFRSIPRRILFFPIRKYVALFGSVKGVPTDVMRVLLLGRTVHRSLTLGRLAGPEKPTDEQKKNLRGEAIRIRKAYDKALDGMDLRLLTGALADGLSQGKGLTNAAVGFARKSFSHDDENPALNPGGEIGAGADRVEEVLRRPEISRLLDEFDARVESELARPTKR